MKKLSKSAICLGITLALGGCDKLTLFSEKEGLKTHILYNYELALQKGIEHILNYSSIDPSKIRSWEKRYSQIMKNNYPGIDYLSIQKELNIKKLIVEIRNTLGCDQYHPSKDPQDYKTNCEEIREILRISRDLYIEHGFLDDVKSLKELSKIRNRTNILIEKYKTLYGKKNT